MIRSRSFKSTNHEFQHRPSYRKLEDDSVSANFALNSAITNDTDVHTDRIMRSPSIRDRMQRSKSFSLRNHMRPPLHSSPSKRSAPEKPETDDEGEENVTLPSLPNILSPRRDVMQRSKSFTTRSSPILKRAGGCRNVLAGMGSLDESTSELTAEETTVSSGSVVGSGSSMLSTCDNHSRQRHSVTGTLGLGEAATGIYKLLGLYHNDSSGHQQGEIASRNEDKQHRALLLIRKHISEAEQLRSQLETLIQHNTMFLTARLESRNDIGTIVSMKQIIRYEADRRQACLRIAELYKLTLRVELGSCSPADCQQRIQTILELPAPACNNGCQLDQPKSILEYARKYVDGLDQKPPSCGKRIAFRQQGPCAA